MKQALIKKYMEGESSCSEERELKRLLRNIPESERNKEEEAILRLLSADALPEEEDIFDADFTAEYDRTVKRRRIRRVLPWAAACAASILALFFVPHKPRSVQTLTQVPATSSVEVVPTPPSQPTEEAVTPAPPSQQVKNDNPRIVEVKTKAKANANPSVCIEQPLPPYETPSPEEIAAVEQQLTQVLEEIEMMDALINEVITNTYQQPYSNYTL